MAQKSNIEWTNATWPIVQGCDPVSQGCAGCYAVPLLHRMAGHPNEKISSPLQGLTEVHVNAAGERILRFTGKVALREDRLTWPLQWKRPQMIFVPSHGDLFHKDVPDEFIDKVFAVMAIASHHTFQVLTKRDKRMRDYCKTLGRHHEIDRVSLAMKQMDLGGAFYSGVDGGWTFKNVWLGVSAERQQEADERIPLLLDTPAAVRFVSLEPLLGPIRLRETLSADRRGDWLASGLSGEERGLDWVIVGGESGPNARPMTIGWAKDLVRQCRDADVPCFVKQLGAHPVNREGQPHRISDRKGAIMTEWPAELRVQEFPTFPKSGKKEAATKSAARG